MKRSWGVINPEGQQVATLSTQNYYPVYFDCSAGYRLRYLGRS